MAARASRPAPAAVSYQVTVPGTWVSGSKLRIIIEGQTYDVVPPKGSGVGDKFTVRLPSVGKRGRASLELHEAVRRCDLSLVKRLVDDGAALTEIDSDGRTPVHLAVVSRSPDVIEMVKILLSADEEEERAEALCTRADDGMSPLHLVATCGTSALMDVMLGSFGDEEELSDVMEMKSQLKGELFNGNWGKKKGGELEELDVGHMTLLHFAVERLSLNDDDDDDDDDEPLSEDARAEAVEMVRLLIQRGADVNARDHHARTPIHQAVNAGLVDVAELLLEAGADPTMGSKAIKMGNTVLHQAVLRGDEAMTRFLVRAAPHLDVDSPGHNGLTPLCLAARRNKEACAKALIESGADPKVVSAFGKSAIDIARTNKRVAILKLFGEEE